MIKNFATAAPTSRRRPLIGTPPLWRRLTSVRAYGHKNMPQTPWMHKYPLPLSLQVLSPMKERGLKKETAQDTAQWRECIHGTRPTPLSRDAKTKMMMMIIYYYSEYITCSTLPWITWNTLFTLSTCFKTRCSLVANALCLPTLL